MNHLYELGALILAVLALGGLIGRMSLKGRLNAEKSKALKAEADSADAQARMSVHRDLDGVSDADLIRRVADTGRARGD
jgi:hypothetical protein